MKNFLFYLTLLSATAAHAADPSNKIATADLRGFVTVDTFERDRDYVSCWGQFWHQVKGAGGQDTWAPVELTGADRITCTLDGRSVDAWPVPDRQWAKLPYEIGGTYGMTFQRANGEVYHLQAKLPLPIHLTYQPGGSNPPGVSMDFSWQPVEAALHAGFFELNNGTAECAATAGKEIWLFDENSGSVTAFSNITEHCNDAKVGVAVSYFNVAEKPASLQLDFFAASFASQSWSLTPTGNGPRYSEQEMKLQLLNRFLRRP